MRVSQLTRAGLAALALLSLLLNPARSLAEPYLAVKSGQPCSSCHTNPTGGGLRTQFGAVYAQSSLSVNSLLDQPAKTSLDLLEGIRVGGNGRFNADYPNLEGVNNSFAYNTERVTLYGQLQLNQRVQLYVDQKVAPGGSLNREAWAKVSAGDWYVKLGKMFQPFGWRLEDDSAFIRRSTGINFNTSDNGIEVGLDTDNWQIQLASTNGAGGGNEVDDGKFVTFRSSWIHPVGRIGISAGNNDADQGDRTLYGVFAGLNTGPVAWLFEYDRISDDIPGMPEEEQDLALVEANWWLIKGHNLKLTLEHQSFDDQDRDRNRVSLIWEYFPWSHTQFRAGVRHRDSDDPLFLEGEEFFIQTHLYF